MWKIVFVYYLFDNWKFGFSSAFKYFHFLIVFRCKASSDWLILKKNFIFFSSVSLSIISHWCERRHKVLDIQKRKKCIQIATLRLFHFIGKFFVQSCPFNPFLRTRHSNWCPKHREQKFSSFLCYLLSPMRWVGITTVNFDWSILRAIFFFLFSQIIIFSLSLSLRIVRIVKKANGCVILKKWIT